MMKKLNVILLGTILTLVFTSCKKDRVTVVSGTLINSISNEPIKEAKLKLVCLKNCDFFALGAIEDGDDGCEVDETMTVYSDDNGHFYVELDCRASKLVVTKKGFITHSYPVKGYKDNFMEIKMDTGDFPGCQ